MTEHKLTYGLREGKLWSIHEVENGLKCQCVCPCCKHPLVARNNEGIKVKAHFAHYKESECAGAYESALHLLAKEVIAKTKSIRIPEFHHDYDTKNSESLFADSKMIQFEKVIVEQSVSVDNDIFQPDVIGIVSGKELYIEFAKTSFVHADKMRKIRAKGISCIELDLRKQELSEEHLATFFESNSWDIYWLFNPYQDKRYSQSELIRKANERKERELLLAKKKAEEEELLQELERSKAKAKRQYDEAVNAGLNVYPMSYGRCKQCPKYLKEANDLIQTRKCNHESIELMKMGCFWNGRIYNRNTVYIDNEEYTIDREGDWENFNNVIQTLNKLKQLMEESICDNCKHATKRIYQKTRYNLIVTQVCNFNKSQSQQVQNT